MEYDGKNNNYGEIRIIIHIINIMSIRIIIRIINKDNGIGFILDNSIGL